MAGLSSIEPSYTMLQDILSQYEILKRNSESVGELSSNSERSDSVEWPGLNEPSEQLPRIPGWNGRAGAPVRRSLTILSSPLPLPPRTLKFPFSSMPQRTKDWWGPALPGRFERSDELLRASDPRTGSGWKVLSNDTSCALEFLKTSFINWKKARFLRRECPLLGAGALLNSRLNRTCHLKTKKQVASAIEVPLNQPNFH